MVLAVPASGGLAPCLPKNEIDFLDIRDLVVLVYQLVEDLYHQPAFR